MQWWDLNPRSFRWFSAIKKTYWHALVGPDHKMFSAVWSYQENLLTCIGGTLTQNLFGDFQLSRKLIDMLWRDFNTKSFRRFSAIKNTYWHALVVPEHEIFSLIFSYQEYLFTCLGGTLTQNLFGEFPHIKNAYWHALVGLYHKVFSLVFSYQIHLFTCIDGT